MTCLALVAIALLSIGIASCDDGKSYAELLDEENKAVNIYLSDHKVIGEVPADSVFEIGPDAPFYKMDEEGFIYMQVLNVGDKENKVEDGQEVYFRFIRYDLRSYKRGEEMSGAGNANNMESSPASFRYGNTTLNSSTVYGSGIQLPLAYLGMGCEVNIIIKSQYGFTDEISDVTPFLYNVRYFERKN